VASLPTADSSTFLNGCDIAGFTKSDVALFDAIGAVADERCAARRLSRYQYHQ
jgi:hypothetical protein